MTIASTDYSQQRWSRSQNNDTSRIQLFGHSLCYFIDELTRSISTVDTNE